uniref:Uncharacterized protein n=1 Tax=Zea mays TaxID=4577 RepID=B4FYN5_MAIZE|nr:unknown [Zea mays]
MKALLVTVLLLLSSTLAASREEPSLSLSLFLCLSLFLTFLPFVLVPHALLLWNFLLASAAICFGYFVRAQAQTTGVSLVFAILPNRHCKLFYRFLCALTSGLRSPDVRGSVCCACFLFSSYASFLLEFHFFISLFSLVDEAKQARRPCI